MPMDYYSAGQLSKHGGELGSHGSREEGQGPLARNRKAVMDGRAQERECPSQSLSGTWHFNKCLLWREGFRADHF